ncbi:toxin-antitoxin system HicB family antitoxin [Chloroflexota bacterium]
MRKVKETLPLESLLDKDYPITLYHAEEGGYVAEIEDLPGCITEGDSLDEVYQRIEEAKKLWIQTSFEDGVEVPLPRTDDDYSGRFLSRVPKYLHRRLAEQAKCEGVSLNQYVETILSSYTSNVEFKDKLVAELKKEIISHVVPPILVPKRIPYESIEPSPLDYDSIRVGA